MDTSDPTEPIRIPLRGADGSIRAHALVDAADAALADLRWHLDGVYVARKIPRDPTEPGGRQRKVLLHREVLGLSHGDDAEGEHVNRNPLDCRRVNLRTVTSGQNKQNVGANVGATSSYRGVSFERASGKWKAAAQLHGKTYSLGRFTNEAVAGEVARAWRSSNMPFANENV